MKGFQSERKPRNEFLEQIDHPETIKSNRSDQIGVHPYLNGIEVTQHDNLVYLLEVHQRERAARYIRHF